jgi:hypothetical protein
VLSAGFRAISSYTASVGKPPARLPRFGRIERRCALQPPAVATTDRILALSGSRGETL